MLVRKKGVFVSFAKKNTRNIINEATTTEPTTLANAVYDTTCTCKVITVI
jgi:hypothetical protein